MRWPDVRIERAENDLLSTADGRTIIDLFAANGTAWIGHRPPAVRQALEAQLQQVWISGNLATQARVEAHAAIEAFLPDALAVHGLYSTGMEAAEYAIRVARAATKRHGVIGFEHSMHGKSLATALLGWDNGDGLSIPFLHRLPFVSTCPEVEILARVQQTLRREAVSAVFVEPVQGTGGGHRASRTFLQELRRLCTAHGALLVFDEILTGFHRTGPPFVFSVLTDPPDIVLLGKGMGSGFPVSAVVADRRYPVDPAMLPGSTYAGNALAAAAVAATLREIRRLDLLPKVRAIEQTIQRRLAPLSSAGYQVRGTGALWVIQVPSRIDIARTVAAIYARGVLVGYARDLIRVLPAATIRPEHLERGCEVLAEELLRAPERKPASPQG